MNDYLIHYNHNHDALGRFARSAGSASSAVGSKLTSRKKEKSNAMRKYESNQRLATKKKKASEAVVKNKQKGSKSNNTKLSESERRRLVDHGSAKEITKNKDKLSNRELEAAITRLQKEKTNRADLERKLSDLSNPTSDKNVKSFVDKLSDAGNTLNKATQAVNSGINAYNAAAKIHNATSQDKWAIIGEKPKDKTSEAMQKIIMTGSAAEVWANRSKMTSKDYTSATVRLGNDAKVKEYMESEKASNDSPKENKTKDKTPTHESFFQEEYKPSAESWKDVREQAAPIIEEKSKNKASDILEDYPDYYDDWKKRKSRY